MCAINYAPLMSAFFMADFISTSQSGILKHKNNLLKTPQTPRNPSELQICYRKFEMKSAIKQQSSMTSSC